jgi:filamentous hemagglutinin family protein
MRFFIFPTFTLIWLCSLNSAIAQSIKAADGGTTINVIGNRSDITGNQVSGINQFHSFTNFNVDAGKSANFIPNNVNIQNILSRVTGGTPSQIQGIIQSSGGVNLFLMNPSGILFGNGASLNVPGSFTATTANAIGFGNNNWFNAAGSNNFTNLTNTPNQFAFTSANPGAIVNTGNLKLSPNQSLNLIAGTVINTGTMATSGGNITIAAVEGGKAVQITPGNSLLSYVLPIEALNAINPAIGNPVSLPQLLTGSPLESASGVEIKNGVVTLVKSQTKIPNQSAVAVVSNTIDVAGEKGGKIDILGKTVGIIDATLNASGLSAGGTVRVGGDYQGKGSIPNATTTVVDRNSKIRVNAIDSGDGGRAIVWSDGTTRYAGSIEANGGKQSGNGGFVEVSGREKLGFTGTVDVSAAQGKMGNVLLDPDEIRIVNGNGGVNDIELADIFAADGGTGIFTISETALEGLSGNVILEANKKITIEDLADNELTFPFANNLKSLLLKTASDGSVQFIDLNDKIDIVTGRVTILSGTVNLGSIQATAPQDDQIGIQIVTNQDIKVGNLTVPTGAISLLSTNGNIKTGKLESGNNGATTTITAPIGNIEVDSIKAGSLTLPSGNGNNLALDIFAGGTFRAIGIIKDNYSYSLLNADNSVFDFLATKTGKLPSEVKAAIPGFFSTQFYVLSPVSIAVDIGDIRIRYAGGGGIENKPIKGVTLQGGDARFELGAKSTLGAGDPYKPLDPNDSFSNFIAAPFDIAKNATYTPIVISNGASGTVGAIVRKDIINGSLSIGLQDQTFGVLPTKPNPKSDPTPTSKVATIDLENRTASTLTACPKSQTIALLPTEATRSPASTIPKSTAKNPCIPDNSDDEILKILK